MRRVLVIGISGAGKSTFARRLAERTGLPLIHLDREFWQPGWKITPEPEWRIKVAALVARDAWIIDGGYSASLDLRLPRADTVFWFDYPRGRCLRRIAWRIATTYGTGAARSRRGLPREDRLGVLSLGVELPGAEPAARGSHAGRAHAR